MELVGLGVVAWILIIAVAIAWIFVPFAVIGTKPLLRELLQELRKNNAMLAEIRSRKTG
jgi:hypothetical protein